MEYGVIIDIDTRKKKEDENGKRRLYRKKRLQLQKRMKKWIKLKRLKNGVYLLPIGDPRKPTDIEMAFWEKLDELFNAFHVKVTYYAATKVKPDFLVFGRKPLDSYFIMSPVRRLRK